jgi:hypothetical protein
MSSIGNYGRFANMLFQVCGVIGIARKNGLQPVFKPLVNQDHKDRFNSTEDIDVWKYFKNPLPAIPSGVRFQPMPVQWGYHDVRLAPGNWDISGHFQSFKYFAHCFDEVKYYLRMKDEYKQNDYCAIHSRLGDYDGAYHPRLGIEYYAAAIEHFQKNQKFLLFSDDRQAAMAMLAPLGRKIEVYEGANYIDDFKMMKSCRHFIIGNSSYSAMAAILGEAKDKKVIAPSADNWFGKAYTNITGADIMMPDWYQIKF